MFRGNRRERVNVKKITMDNYKVCKNEYNNAEYTVIKVRVN